MGRRTLGIARTLAISSLVAAVMIPIQSSPSSAQTCANADLLPPVGNSAQDRAARQQVAFAVGCLIQAEHRKATGRALVGSLPLARAAGAHAQASVTHKWWASSNSHVNPRTGSTIDSRIRAQGFCGTRPVAQTAEITYNGSGSGSTARAAVNWWMNSPGHRAIITSSSLTDVGIGYMPGLANTSIPSSNNMMTYVLNFGRCA